MPLIEVAAVLVAVGFLLWIINRFIPMAGSIKSILNGVVVIVVGAWLLKVAGLWGSITKFHMGK
ncbi:MAG TPA: Thivi_2564 family membrane protein [Terriglobia bacterium]|nr:Thivi_2564 family membrane protein [Terriglobia bacterium]